MHQEFYKIEKLLDYALLAPQLLGKGIYLAGEVDWKLAQRINQAIGVETRGFRITIDHSSILHILRQHGNAGPEALRGQLPIENADIVRLAQWLTCPSHVEDAGQNPGETRCLRFQQAYAGTLATAVLSVRTGRLKQQLSLKTMYKKKLAV